MKIQEVNDTHIGLDTVCFNYTGIGKPIANDGIIVKENGRYLCDTKYVSVTFNGDVIKESRMYVTHVIVY